MGKVCCFSGHREIPYDRFAKVAVRTETAVLRAIAAGADIFLTGGALGYDTLAARTVLKVKRQHPEISLWLVLPCHDQSAPWREADRRAYEEILAAADEVIYLADAYYDGCMLARNREMVDRADLMIYYLARNRGGTAYTVRYAAKKGIPMFNVAPPAP